MPKKKVEHGRMLMDLLGDNRYNRYEIYLITRDCGCTQHSATSMGLVQAASNAETTYIPEDKGSAWHHHGEILKTELVRGKV